MAWSVRVPLTLPAVVLLSETVRWALWPAAKAIGKAAPETVN